MQNRPTQQQKSTTAYLLQGLQGLKNTFALPALNGASTVIANSAKEIARGLDRTLPIKEQLKTKAAQGLSAVNAFTIGYTGIEFFSEMILNGTWQKLSPSQKILIGTSAIFALAEAGYSMSVYGDNHHIVAAGTAAAVSTLTFNLAKVAATHFAHRNNVDQSYAVLPAEDESLLRHSGP